VGVFASAIVRAGLPRGAVFSFATYMATEGSGVGVELDAATAFVPASFRGDVTFFSAKGSFVLLDDIPCSVPITRISFV
jgi:hypothetical protein